MTRRFHASLLVVILCTPIMRAADALPTIDKVAAQPLAKQVHQLVESLDNLGNPLPEKDVAALDEALKLKDETELKNKVESILDPHCLVGIEINPESRVKAIAGDVKKELVEQGWRTFPIKVVNRAGVTADLRAKSPNALPVPSSSSDDQVRDRWMDIQMANCKPLTPKLTGLSLEYRVIQLYSRDVGKRSATISFDVGQGTQDVAFGSDVTILFDAAPSTEITFNVLDENDKPTTAAFIIRDKQKRVHPSQAKRLAPDFQFHPQVYRDDGEKIRLPAGDYTIDYSRGPESIPGTMEVKVDDKPQTLTFHMKRWVDPAKLGWWSGDHHIHAAGCAHYNKPTEGVFAADMARHCRGEDLKIGCNLTWGPCFDFQKQFFTGKIDDVSKYPYLLRYDVEVSGFGSHKSGHLCLLRLKEQIYPGGNSTNHWPTLCLNTLKWAKKQGAICGPAHSGFGLEVKGDKLPSYEIPPYNSIGANEYVVDVTHEVEGADGKLVPAVDFMSLGDTPYVWELNMWYHTLNCGFRTRASGETDFPCINGERVGLARSYIKLADKLDYDSWCDGIRLGHGYVSDGRSHIMDFKANDVEMSVGEPELKLKSAGDVKLQAKVAAMLPEKPNDNLRNRPYTQQYYWHLERSRIGDTRNVKIEAVVNGIAVASKEIPADGSMQDVALDVKLERSSWVALRILPSSHTNPIFVLVDDKPIRASKKSVEWCLKGVDKCYAEKKKVISDGEQKQAIEIYDHAREAYRKRLTECGGD